MHELLQNATQTIAEPITAVVTSLYTANRILQQSLY